MFTIVQRTLGSSKAKEEATPATIPAVAATVKAVSIQNIAKSSS